MLCLWKLKTPLARSDKIINSVRQQNGNDDDDDDGVRSKDVRH